MKKEVLRKVSIKEKKDNSTYFVEDIFSSEKLIMKLTGKMRMNYIRLSMDDIVYMVLPNKDSIEGTAIFEKYICLHNEDSELCQQKRKIESIEKTKNENNSHWQRKNKKANLENN